jgi:hypothetical protein
MKIDASPARIPKICGVVAVQVRVQERRSNRPAPAGRIENGHSRARRRAVNEQVEIGHGPGCDRLGEAGAHRRALDHDEIHARGFERVENPNELLAAQHVRQPDMLCLSPDPRQFLVGMAKPPHVFVQERHEAQFPPLHPIRVGELPPPAKSLDRATILPEAGFEQPAGAIRQREAVHKRLARGLRRASRNVFIVKR